MPKKKNEELKQTSKAKSSQLPQLSATSKDSIFRIVAIGAGGALPALSGQAANDVSRGMEAATGRAHAAIDEP